VRAPDIRQLVEAEIAGDWSRTSLHGVDLRKCLAEPRKAQFCIPLPRGGPSLPFWIVLEEKPGKKEGLLLVFDEETHQFGLAIWDGDTPVFPGFHGSFLDTLEGM
jgi:hypothetical protein